MSCARGTAPQLSLIHISFHEALFTSTSAVCVTGLVVLDTGSDWSAFGQTVILLLIQIGGLGVITGAVTFLMLSGRNITLKERSACLLYTSD